MDPAVYSRRDLLRVLGAAAAMAPLQAGAQPFAERMPQIPRYLWGWVRSQLVLEPGLVWLDTAAFGPALQAVMVESYRSLERQSLNFQSFEHIELPAVTRSALEAAGRFLGVTSGELVVTQGARAGIALVAAGLELQAGDEVLTTAHEHPACVYPWLVQSRRRGTRVVQLPAGSTPTSPDEIVQRIARALTPRTRVLQISHVQHADGTVMPVRELCSLARDRGVFTVVDGTLSAGQFDFGIADLGCDAYAVGIDRWLNGPAGVGLLYVRRESQPVVWPIMPDHAEGWDSSDRHGRPLSTTPDESVAAQRRLGNAALSPSVAAMPVALEFQLAVQRARLGARVLELAAHARRAFARVPGIELSSSWHPALASGIVTLRTPGRAAAGIVAALAAEERIVVGHVDDGSGSGAIRVSLHPANDEIDIDRCASAIERRL